MLTKIKTAVYAAIPTSAAAAITAALASGDWRVILGAALGPFVPVVGAYLKPEPIDSALGYLRRKGIDVKPPVSE